MKEKPKTAYDVRRYLTLVQVLALNDTKAIRELCFSWGIEVPMITNDIHGYIYPNWIGAITALAQHALDYHRHTDTE